MEGRALRQELRVGEHLEDRLLPIDLNKYSAPHLEVDPGPGVVLQDAGDALRRPHLGGGL